MCVCMYVYIIYYSSSSCLIFKIYLKSLYILPVCIGSVAFL